MSSRITINNPPTPQEKIRQINRVLSAFTLAELKELLSLILRYFPLDIQEGSGVTITKDLVNGVYIISASGSGTGTVTSVDASSGGPAVSFTGGPITTSGILLLNFNGTSSQYIAGDGSLVNFPTLGTGTVTSVGLSVPSAFSVSGSPITTSGTFLISAVGTASDYIRGDGTLAAFPSIPSGTVTSVSLSVSGALSASGVPITSAGTIALNWTGTALQYVRGDGTLGTLPSGTGTVTSVSASVPSPVNPAFSVVVSNPTTTPAIAISANGTTGQYVRGDGSLSSFVDSIFPPFYGSGFDGIVTLDGSTNFNAFSTRSGSVYTLTRAIYCTNLTINTGVTLDPNGFAIHCKGSLTLIGTAKISSNGNNGNNASGSTLGTGGASKDPGITNYVLTRTGAAGGNGGNASNNAGNITVSVNYIGGVGGSGAFGFPAGNSGVGTTTTRGVVTVNAGVLQQPFSDLPITNSIYFGSTQMYCSHSGAGGQCGINAGGSIQGAGGGGGSSPRPIAIFASSITIPSTALIQSNGGNGGNGGNATSGNGTGGGGGGGGGGGFIWIVTSSLSYTPANRIQALGGAGGAGGLGVGTVNGQNVNGVASQSGSNGVDGYVVIINASNSTNITYTGQI